MILGLWAMADMWRLEDSFVGSFDHLHMRLWSGSSVHTADISQGASSLMLKQDELSITSLKYFLFFKLWVYCCLRWRKWAHLSNKSCYDYAGLPCPSKRQALPTQSLSAHWGKPAFVAFLSACLSSQEAALVLSPFSLSCFPCLSVSISLSSSLLASQFPLPK